MKPPSPPSRGIGSRNSVSRRHRSGLVGESSLRPQCRLRKSYDRPLTLPSPGGRGFFSPHMKCSKYLLITSKLQALSRRAPGGRGLALERMTLHHRFFTGSELSRSLAHFFDCNFLGRGVPCPIRSPKKRECWWRTTIRRSCN